VLSFSGKPRAPTILKWIIVTVRVALLTLRLRFEFTVRARPRLRVKVRVSLVSRFGLRDEG
jgi:hypothetical protein